MTPADIRNEMAALNSKDEEAAHYAEDALMRDIIWLIAAGAQNAKELAEEFVLNYDDEATRWYA